MKNKIIYLVLLTFATVNSYSQVGKSEVKGNKEYDKYAYIDAIKTYERIYEKGYKSPDMLLKIGNAYYFNAELEKANKWYSELYTTNPDQEAEFYYRYSQALRAVKDYPKADAMMAKFNDKSCNTLRGEKFAKGRDYLAEIKKNSGRYKIEDAGINSKYSDYGPAYMGTKVIFTSARDTGNFSKRIHTWTGQYFTNLYSSALAEDGSLSGVDKFGKKINTKYHEGPAALLPDGTLMFTRNNYFKGKAKKSAEGIIKLKLFTATAPGLDEVKPFPYNSDEYSVGHPALNSTGTLLIFASDMPGGLGGTDLYYCTRASVKEEWGKPVNMGKTINTEGDELFPTLYQDTQLFFSSTGHAGLGGLDIFEIGLDGTNPVASPINLGAPVNSSVDDFSLVRNRNGQQGFFTSNRRGNDDIYTFNYRDYRIILKGTVTASGQPVSNINIAVANQAQKLNIKTDANGAFLYELPKQSLTSLGFDIPGYTKQELSVSTNDIETDTILIRNIALQKIEQIAKVPVLTKDCDSIRQMLKQFILYYDLDKSFIRKDAAAVADKLALFLKQNPQFDLVASSYCDSRASFDYNIKLSLRRSKSAKQYLVNKGIAADRIKIRYFGEQDLVNNCKDGVNCTEAEQQLNRRTQFFLLYKGKKAIDLDCETLLLVK